MNDDAIPLLEQLLTPVPQREAAFFDVRVREGVFPAGQFSIALPRDWRGETVGADVVPEPAAVVTLARFAPAGPDGYAAAIAPAIEVHCAALPREMNGSDWLIAWGEDAGFTFHAFTERPVPQGLMGDATAKHSETGRVHRMITVRYGDLLFVVDGSFDAGPRNADPAMQEFALIAASRFTLLDPPDQLYAEPMDEAVMTGRSARARFLVPQSWAQGREDGAPTGGAVLQRVNALAEGTAGLMLGVLGTPGLDAAGLEDTLVQKLALQGFSFGAPEPLGEGSRQSLALAVLERSGDGPNGAMILRCLRATNYDRPLSLCVLSPAADVDFEVWAVNRRAFEIAVGTLEIDVG